ncbi:MAG: DNA-binding protein [Phormidesmis sp. RL_2_1]|nr:DNA-binding protein [Phormidesmis sp. RL_2_1]
MKTLFLSWQNPISRAWFPIGRLDFDGDLYRFRYIHGALVAQAQGQFRPIRTFPELHHLYESPRLFPLFENRLLRRSRPEYSDYVQWLNIPEKADDPIALLSRSGGQRVTDTFEVFPCPQRDENGLYHIHFFVHGLRYMPPETQPNLQQLQPGIRLYIMQDSQNPYDPDALLLRTEEAYNVGYCPRYLTSDVLNLLQHDSQKLAATVERVNPHPTPVQFRLLCNLTAEWPKAFQPFTGELYEPLVGDRVSAIA